MQIDQFESQFKRAIKEPYSYHAVNIAKVLVITDFEANATEKLSGKIREMIPELGNAESTTDYVLFDRSKYFSPRDLLEKIDNAQPDLLVVQRNMWSADDSLVYGLSNYLDALTQVCPIPVMILPNINLDSFSDLKSNISTTMVETDHITGDNRLINWGVRFAGNTGTLFLTHLEDDGIFNYYIDIIGKIPQIDTEIARETICETLIKLPTDFIGEVSSVLKVTLPELYIEGIVKLGHTIDDYQKILKEHSVDLLILNSKVDGQLAMAGKAYSMAVEFKHLPLLLL